MGTNESLEAAVSNLHVDEKTETTESKSTTKVLVTGGTGFPGSNLVKKLLKQGNEVIVLDNFWTSRASDHDDLASHPSCTMSSTPYRSISAPKRFHLACPASPVHFAKEPISILGTCYRGTKNALEAARLRNAKLLLASTSEVYGDRLVCPQGEDYFGNVNPFGPRACYDEGKRVAEALVYAYRHEHNLDLKVARLFNVYGSGMPASDGRVIGSFIAQALSGQDVRISGDGSAIRSFQFVDDCVDGLCRLMQSDWDGGPINLGREVETCIADLARLVVERVSLRTGKPCVGVERGTAMPEDPVRRRPDCLLARRVLGWSAETEVEEGLDRTIAWHVDRRMMAKRG